MNNTLFFDLLKVALGNQECLSKIPNKAEWSYLLDMAEKQCVDGITFDALSTLTQHGQKVPEELMLDWFSYSEQIKKQNKIVNQRCKDITSLFAKAGYKTCILKGQGNAIMYPNPMSRVSGDIDIWVKGDRNDIIQFCNTIVAGGNRCYHHIDFPIFEDVPVEVHFIPSYSRIPRFNKRIQRFFDSFQTEEIHILDNNGGDCTFCIPEKTVNLVFQMSHIMRHFFFNGIGFRQMIDYYYLLKYLREQNADYNATQRTKVREYRVDAKIEEADTKGINYEELFCQFGMLKFAGAVMWIMKEILGMDEEFLIVSPDEKRGKLVLDELMEGGNFGNYDERWIKQLKKKSATMSAIVRNIRLVSLFPEDAIWGPINGAYRYLEMKWISH